MTPKEKAQQAKVLLWWEKITQFYNNRIVISNDNKVNFFIIGIDPGGKSCGVSILPPDNKILTPVARCLESYKEEHQSSYKGKIKSVGYNFTDTTDFGNFLAPIITDTNNMAIAFIEDVHVMPTDSKIAAFNFGRNFGAILGILQFLMIPTIKISPNLWKNYFWSRSEKADDKAGKKEASVEKVKQMYPALAQEFLKKKDHNQAEALLIATYGKQQLITYKMEN